MAISGISTASQNNAIQTAQTLNTNPNVTQPTKGTSKKTADTLKQSPVEQMSHAHDMQQLNAKKVGITHFGVSPTSIV